MNFQSLGRTALPFLGFGAGLASLIGLSFFGQSRDSQQFSQVDNPVVPITSIAEDPPLPPADDFGGAKDSLLPALTGVSNRENRWGHSFKVFGKCRIYPALAAEPYPTATGAVQTISGVFDCGPGELAFSEPQINGRPISEFPSLTLEYHYGKASDTPFTLYTQAVSNVKVNEELVITTAPVVVSKQAGRQANRIGVNITFPNGLYQRNSTTGVIEDSSVTFFVSLTDAQGNAPVAEYVTATAKQSTPYFLYREWAVPDGLYTVRVLRYTPATNATPNVVNNSTWTDLVAYGAGPAFYPHYNSIGQRVYMAEIAYRAQATASLNGSLGEFSILASSKFPIWDGTTWSDPAETNNPAWLIVGALREAFAYRPAVDAQIDLPRFLEFANWCTSKNFTYNRAIPGEMTLYEACQEIARAGRAVFFVRDGKFSVCIDKPVEIVSQVFTERNIIKGSLSMKLSLIEPPDYLAVDWINPANDWQLDVYKVYDDGKSAGTHFKRDTLSMPGVTNSDQVYKLTRYYMAQNRLRTAVYQWSADIENIICELGDRVTLTTSRLGAGLGQGRISAITTNGGGAITTITLDSPQVLDLNSRYGLRIRLADNTTVVVEVQAVAGLVKTFTLITPLASAAVNPAVGDLCAFGEYQQEGRDIIVTGVKLNPDLSATIYGVDYAPEIFQADSGTIPPYVSVVSRPRRLDRTVPTPKILFAQSDETVLDEDIDGSLRVRILLTLEAPITTIDSLEYEISPAGANAWSVPRSVSAAGGAISIFEVQQGSAYDIRVRAIRGNFRSDAYAYVYNHLVIGKSSKPPSVTMLFRKPNSTKIGWPEIERPRDFFAYQVRAAFGDAEAWDQAMILGEAVTINEFDLGAFAKGLKTIMVKAVDTSGNFSDTPAVLKTDFGDISEQNVEFEYDHHPAFDGTKTDATVSGGILYADDDGANFFKADDNLDFYGSDDSADMYTVQYKTAGYSYIFMPDPSFAFPYRYYHRADISASGYAVEYRAMTESNFYSQVPNADSQPFYGLDDAANFYAEDFGPWLPFPTNGLEIQALTQVPVRFTLFGGQYQGRITSLTDVIDLPDLEIYYNDFAVAPGGSRLPTTGDFSRIDNISITVQDATNKSATYTEKNSPLGPLITVFSGGVSVSGSVDVIVRGIR